MKSLLLGLLALVAGAVAALAFKDDTGYVLVSFGHYRLETSLLGWVLLCGGAALLLAASLSLLGMAWRLPSAVRKGRAARLARASQLGFELGLSRLFEGDWHTAEIQLVRRAADHRAPHLNYLAAARAAQRQGAADRRDRYLALARKYAPKREVMLRVTEAELQRARGEWDRVHASALALHATAPRHQYAFALLLESCAALGHARELREHLAHPLAAQAVDAATLARYAAQSSAQLFTAAAQLADLAMLNSAWAATPAATQSNPEVVLAAAKAYAQVNAADRAAHCIGQYLAHTEHAFAPALAALYGQLPGQDALTALSEVEGWLKQWGEQPALLGAAGRLAMAVPLWGKAQSYLEAYVSHIPDAEAYLALAEVLQKQGLAADAHAILQRGMQALKDAHSTSDR